MKDQHQIFFNVEVAGSHVLPHEKDLVIFVQFWAMQIKQQSGFLACVIESSSRCDKIMQFCGGIMGYKHICLMKRKTYKENVFSDWCHLSIHLMDLDEISFAYPTLALLWLLEHSFSTLIFFQNLTPVECI